MGHAHHQHGGHDESNSLAEVLELDAEVLHGFLDEALQLIAGSVDGPSARILDLGAGTGVGSIALAERFPSSEVAAFDVSPEMLERLLENSRRRGVAARIHPALVDLDDEWPMLDPVDLGWAAGSVHHVRDPDRLLRRIFSVLRPGGLLTVLEIEEFPEFLPERVGVGRPGLESRVSELMARRRARDMPTLGSDWAPRLSSAGFALELARRISISLPAPGPEGARYAELSLRRARAGLRDELDTEDLAALDELLDPTSPHAILHRDDLNVRAARSLWIGRKPALSAR